ncbi:MAG: hypothetical protein MJ094_03555 [Saccharofermentans sp.]|nr:hypothetical protein [Saccharofermentans sp.]
MKLFKKIIATLVVFSLLFTVVACEKDTRSIDDDRDERQERDEDSSDEKNPEVDESSVDEEEESQEGHEASITQAYYDYIRDVLIPSEGLTNLDGSIIVSFQSTPIHETSDINARNGILSADVRDYNGDGVLDLVTYSLDSIVWDHTSTGLVMSEWYGEQRNFYGVTARFYSLIDGEITLLDQVDSITEFGADHVGTMYYGVYDDEGSVFIYGFCNTETVETYSVRKLNIYHIDGDSFVFDATSGFYGFGQASVDSDPNVVCGTLDYNYGATALGTAISNASFASVTNGIGDGMLLGGVQFAFYNNMTQVEATYYDVSRLRDVLSDGVTVLDNRPSMPVYDAPDNVDPTELADRIALDISNAAGFTLTYLETDYISGGGVNVRYTNDGGDITLSLRFDEDGKLQVVNCTLDTWNITSEWIAFKDAIFTYAPFEINPDDYQSWLGDCDMNQTPLSNDDYSIVVARMDQIWVNISFSN